MISLWRDQLNARSFRCPAALDGLSDNSRAELPNATPVVLQRVNLSFLPIVLTCAALAIFAVGALFGASIVEADHRQRKVAGAPLCELAEEPLR